MTRFVAMYHSQTPPLIGPLRSGRTSDYEILNMLNNPVFVTSGGNENVLQGLSGVRTVRIDNSLYGVPYFVRGTGHDGHPTTCTATRRRSARWSRPTPAARPALPVPGPGRGTAGGVQQARGRSRHRLRGQPRRRVPLGSREAGLGQGAGRDAARQRRRDAGRAEQRDAAVHPLQPQCRRLPQPPRRAARHRRGLAADRRPGRRRHVDPQRLERGHEVPAVRRLPHGAHAGDDLDGPSPGRSGRSSSNRPRGTSPPAGPVHPLLRGGDLVGEHALHDR